MKSAIGKYLSAYNQLQLTYRSRILFICGDAGDIETRDGAGQLVDSCRKTDAIAAHTLSKHEPEQFAALQKLGINHDVIILCDKFFDVDVMRQREKTMKKEEWNGTFAWNDARSLWNTQG